MYYISSKIKRLIVCSEQFYLEYIYVEISNYMLFLMSLNVFFVSKLKSLVW